MCVFRVSNNNKPTLIYAIGLSPNRPTSEVTFGNAMVNVSVKPYIQPVVVPTLKRAGRLTSCYVPAHENWVRERQHVMMGFKQVYLIPRSKGI